MSVWSSALLLIAFLCSGAAAVGLEARPEAIAEYLKAYEIDVRFVTAAVKYVELAARQPATAKEMVHRLWLAHPEQHDINLLHRKLQAVDAPEQVRAVIAEFQQAAARASQ